MDSDCDVDQSTSGAVLDFCVVLGRSSDGKYILKMHGNMKWMKKGYSKSSEYANTGKVMKIVEVPMEKFGMELEEINVLEVKRGKENQEIKLLQPYNGENIFEKVLFIKYKTKTIILFIFLELIQLGNQENVEQDQEHKIKISGKIYI